MDHLALAKARSYEETVGIIRDAANGVNENVYIWMNGRGPVLRSWLVKKAGSERITIREIFDRAGLGVGFSGRLNTRKTMRAKSFVKLAKVLDYNDPAVLYKELTLEIGGTAPATPSVGEAQQGIRLGAQSNSDMLLEVWVRPTLELTVVLPFTGRAFSVDPARAAQILPLLLTGVDNPTPHA